VKIIIMFLYIYMDSFIHPWNPRTRFFGWCTDGCSLKRYLPICLSKVTPRDNAPQNKKKIFEILFTLNGVYPSTNKIHLQKI
jgi:hypothetical protein